MRVRTPRPAGGCHQCCTSPSTNCRAAARRICAAGLAGRAVDQGHHVLELVAEAVGAARLVERRPAPDAAAQHLVEQPAVEQQVERRVGRLHLDGAEDRVPARLDRRRAPRRAGPARGSGGRSSRAALDGRRPRRGGRRPPSPRPGPSSNGAWSAAQGSSAGPDAAGQLDPAAARRARRPSRCGRGTRCGRPVTVRGRRSTSAKATPAGEVGAEGVAGEQGAGLGVELGDDVQRRVRRGRSRAPTRRRTSPTAAAAGRPGCGPAGGSA